MDILHPTPNFDQDLHLKLFIMFYFYSFGGKDCKIVFPYFKISFLRKLWYKFKNTETQLFFLEKNEKTILVTRRNSLNP